MIATCIRYSISILVLGVAGTVACVAQQATKNKPALRSTPSLSSATKDDCETRIGIVV